MNTLELEWGTLHRSWNIQVIPWHSHSGQNRMIPYILFEE